MTKKASINSGHAKPTLSQHKHNFPWKNQFEGSTQEVKES